MKSRAYFITNASRTAGLAVLTAALVAACGGGGGGAGASNKGTPPGAAVAAQAPRLNYDDSSEIYTFGQPILIAPNSVGGPITHYTVFPDLPAGLTFDPMLGTISGTPTEVREPTTYKITVSNSAGSSTASIRIEVKSQDSINEPKFAYPNKEYIFELGTDIGRIAPTNYGGAVTQYSIDHRLPDGLQFNEKNGEITGTPRKEITGSMGVFRVTGKNNSGENCFILTIEVSAKIAPPRNLKYGTPNIVGTVGTQISSGIPTAEGGRITKYTVAPVLPDGLSLDETTGVISGTPNHSLDKSTYSVTGSNSGGSVKTDIEIEVRNAKASWASVSAHSLNVSRAMHAAILLPDQRLLVLGGEHDGQALKSAEVYDPKQKKWLRSTDEGGIPDMNFARENATVVLLDQGKVLVVGGSDGHDGVQAAEIYDPVAKKWKVAASMGQSRLWPTVTPLPGGKVLVAGGYVGGSATETAEVFDPSVGDKGSWTPTRNNMGAPRAEHAATLFTAKDGSKKVLVVGGQAGSETNGQSVTTAEVYDLQTGQWSVIDTQSMSHKARRSPSATLLTNGNVLVTGGVSAEGGAVSVAELYNCTTGLWSVVENGISPDAFPTSVGVGYSTTVLKNGMVLVAGGRAFGAHGGTGRMIDRLSVSSDRASLFDPQSNRWRYVNNMPEVRDNHTATLLPDGTVLIIGGETTNLRQRISLATTALFTP